MKEIIGQTPQVSVVLPVYNAARFVEEAVLSVVKQTYTDWELVVIDDSSTDSSYAKLTQLARTYPKIRLYRNRDNRGIGFTMTRLVRLARGKYIARMDADDIMTPIRIERQVNFLAKNPTVGILGSYMGEIDINREIKAVRKVPLEDKAIKKNLLIRQAIQNPTLMINMSRIPRDELYFDSRFSPADDLDFFLRLTKRGVKFANIPEYLMIYRSHGDNSSLRDIQKSFSLTTVVREKAIALGMSMGWRSRITYALQKLAVPRLKNDLLYTLYHLWQGNRIPHGYYYPKVVAGNKAGISLIMPVYRAAPILSESVKRIVYSMRSTGKDFELIVIEDGQVDATRNAMHQLLVHYPELKYYTYLHNRGKGYAVRFGMEKASKDYVGYIDAGHDIDTGSLTSIVHALDSEKNIDAYFAVKNHPLSDLINVPWYRKVFSWCFHVSTSLLFGQLGDTQVGLKIFKRSVVKKLLKLKLVIDRFAFDVELVKVLRDMDASVSRHPVVIRRNGEKSSVRLSDIMRMAYDIVRIRLSRYGSKSRSLSKRGTDSGAYKSRVAVMGNG